MIIKHSQNSAIYLYILGKKFPKCNNMGDHEDWQDHLIHGFNFRSIPKRFSTYNNKHMVREYLESAGVYNYKIRD